MEEQFTYEGLYRLLEERRDQRPEGSYKMCIRDSVYFVHSFAGFDCKGQCTATTEYGAELTAAVQNGNVYGTQFHPEKSGAAGLAILKAFCELE